MRLFASCVYSACVYVLVCSVCVLCIGFAIVLSSLRNLVCVCASVSCLCSMVLRYVFAYVVCCSSVLLSRCVILRCMICMFMRCVFLVCVCFV